MPGGGWYSFMLDGHVTPSPPDIINISDGSSEHDDDHEEEKEEEEEEDAIIISDDDGDEDGDERGMFIYTRISYAQLYSSDK